MEIKAKIVVDAIQPISAFKQIGKAIQDLKNVVLRPKVSLEAGEADARSLGARLKERIKEGLGKLKAPDIDASTTVVQAQATGRMLGMRLKEGFDGILTGAFTVGLGNVFTRIAEGAFGVAKNLIQASAEAEQMATSFAVMLGSATEAERMISEIKRFSAVTPYTAEDLTRVTQTMLGFGIPAEQVMQNLQMLGDVAMGNSERLRMLGLAFSQVQAAGRLTGQDLLQMINAGFNPLRIISEKTGLSIGELKKKMEEGAISAEMVRNAFRAATSEGGQFFGMSAKQGQTFSGMLSTLRDNVKAFGIAIMKDVFEQMKGILVQVVEFVGNIRKVFSEQGLYGVFTYIFPPAIGAMIYGTLKSVVDAIQWVAKVIWSLRAGIAVIAGIAVAWVAVAKTIAIVKGAVLGIVTVVKMLSLAMAVNPFAVLIGAAVAAVVLIITYWSEIKNFFKGLWEGVKNVFVSAWSRIKDAIKFVMKGVWDVMTLTNPIGLLIRTMQGDWGLFQGILDKLKAVFGETFRKIVNFASETVSQIINWFKNWWKSVEEGDTIFADIFRRIREFAEGVTKVISFVWGKIIAGIEKAIGVVKEAWDWVKENIFGQKEVTTGPLPAAMGGRPETEAERQRRENAEKTLQLLQKAKEQEQQATKKSEEAKREEAKKTAETEWKFAEKTTEAKKQQIDKRKEIVSEFYNWVARKTEESEEAIRRVATREAKEQIEMKIASAKQSLQELEYEKSVLETFEQQKALRAEILQLEKERIEIQIQDQMAMQLREQAKATKELEEQYRKAIEATKKGSKERAEVEKQYKEIVEKLNEEHTLKIESINAEKNRKLIELERQHNSDITRLEKKRLEETTKTVVESSGKVFEAVKAFQERFSGLVKEKVGIDTSEIDNQIDELDRAFVRAQMTEAEYTTRRKELSEKRKKIIEEESGIWETTFASAFGVAMNTALELDAVNLQLQNSMEQLFSSLKDLTDEFVLKLIESKDAISDWGSYLEATLKVVEENWETMANFVLTQTLALGGQLVAKGVPAFEAFKKAFLLSILDMVEKLVISQIPAIKALVSGTIPFPANLPIIAVIVGAIMAGLEVAKAKIRGAERGYLAGFREGRKGPSDTMLIYVNPREAILPVDVVERNKETIKLMLQGLSLDKQATGRLPTNFVAIARRSEQVANIGLPAKGLKIKIENDVRFAPLRMRTDEMVFLARKQSERIRRLQR